jgi:hypothetical protein
LGSIQSDLGFNGFAKMLLVTSKEGRTMQVMNNKHTPLAKGAKLQKFNHHHRVLQQRDKNDNVQAHYLGTYPQRTCGTTTSSKTMDAL